MSGASTQGVGAATSANAEEVSAASAAATTSVLLENVVIIVLPATVAAAASVLNKSRTPRSRQHNRSIGDGRLRLCDFRFMASRLSCSFSLESTVAKLVIGMIRMNLVMKVCLGAALAMLALVS